MLRGPKPEFLQVSTWILYINLDSGYHAEFRTPHGIHPHLVPNTLIRAEIDDTRGDRWYARKQNLHMNRCHNKGYTLRL